MTRRVVSILLVAIFISAYVFAQDASRHFKSTAECGYEFDYPAGWSAEALPADKYTRCAAQVRPLDFKKRMAENDVDIYTLTVSVPGGGTFLDAANRSGFDFYGGKWVTRGRLGHRGSASIFVTTQWSGVRGKADVGCHHEHGGYAGLCEFERVVVQNLDEDMWVMEGGPQTGQVFERVLATFRFAR